MMPVSIHELRPRIIEGRDRLEAAAPSLPAAYVNGLLAEIDAALQRIDHGSYGLCETCGDPIERDRLERNPLERFCVDHLSPAELRAHQQDLELATEIQTKLLPPRQVALNGWETHFRYVPAGIVSGDYCEVAPSKEGSSLFFAVGDVAGKGVAASLLMTHLSAIFRSLLTLDLPLTEMMCRANRLFCEGTVASHYATLVAGRTSGTGVDLCNAGHCKPVLLRHGSTECIEAAGLPLGLFCDGCYSVTRVVLEPGDSLVLYSDGITEAEDPGGAHYEEERLYECLSRHGTRDVAALAEEILEDVAGFRNGRPPRDDVTLLVIRRSR